MQAEKLKPEEFDSHIVGGTCRVAFVGMSNAGKSYRSHILESECGFLWYQVDEKIGDALEHESVAWIASWLGYPSSQRYSEREGRYLDLENTFTKEAAMQTNGRNLVFDTTGSVTQLEKNTLDILDDNCLIVHLDVGEDAIAKLIKKFFQDPKPVCWGEFFSIGPGESEEAALKRCYPRLLSERLKRYRALAHLNIKASELYNTSGKETLAIIKSHLRV